VPGFSNVNSQPEYVNEVGTHAPDEKIAIDDLVKASAF